MPALLHSAWSVFLVVIFFEGSIFVHELGHFLAARRRGVHVERFSVGFGPALWSRRGRDGVEYCLCWIPFGGYVMLPQLADLGPLEGPASRVDLSKLPPLSYATKIVVFAAGAFFNVLFAFALACVIWAVGQPVPGDVVTTRIGNVAQTLELADGTRVASPAVEAGLKVGDVVRAIDGHAVSDWSDLQQTTVMSAGRDAGGAPFLVMTIERDGRRMDLPVHPRLAGFDKVRTIGISQWYDLIVAGFNADVSLGRKLGFQVGDRIVSLDGNPVPDFPWYADYLANHRGPVAAVVARTAPGARESREVAITVPARAGPPGPTPLGLELTTNFKIVHPLPWIQIRDQVVTTFRTLASLLNPRSDLGLSKMSGPVGIVHVLLQGAGEAGLSAVLFLTILINVNLAIINLLPIPVMDGGQMLMATIARLRGRALPVEWVVKTQSVFVVLILSVFVYLTVFNIRDWVHEVQVEHASAEKP
jgi:regulator of sigma E protease